MRYSRWFKYDVKWTKMVKIFTLLLTIGCLLSVIVNMIPEERIRSNIANSLEYMNEEKCYPYMGVKDVGYALDNYTEASVLNFMYTADNARPIYCAFVQQEYFPQEWNSGLDCLNGVINEYGEEMTGHLSSRSAYWVGYSIFLRPLLYFTDYYNIRSINNIFAMLFMVMIAILIAKRMSNYVSVALATVLCFFNYYVLSLNITLGIFCVYVMYGAIVYILLKDGKINYGYTMLVIGMLTAFFEWFSIPFITFGIPMLFLIYLARGKEKQKFSYYFNITFQSGISWCLGYGGMIIAKPIIVQIISGSGGIEYFLNRFEENSIYVGKGPLEFVVALKNLIRLVFPIHLLDEEHKTHQIYILILLLGIVLCGLLLYKKERAYQAICFILAISPLAWYWMFRGHMGHLGIDYRTLMVSAFAMLLMVEKPLKDFWERLKKRWAYDI